MRTHDLPVRLSLSVFLLVRGNLAIRLSVSSPVMLTVLSVCLSLSLGRPPWMQSLTVLSFRLMPRVGLPLWRIFPVDVASHAVLSSFRLPPRVGLIP